MKAWTEEWGGRWNFPPSPPMSKCVKVATFHEMWQTLRDQRRHLYGVKGQWDHASLAQNWADTLKLLRWCPWSWVRKVATLSTAFLPLTHNKAQLSQSVPNKWSTTNHRGFTCLGEECP